MKSRVFFQRLLYIWSQSDGESSCDQFSPKCICRRRILVDNQDAICHISCLLQVLREKWDHFRFESLPHPIGVISFVKFKRMLDAQSS
jgi:hypothetical protein